MKKLPNHANVETAKIADQLLAKPKCCPLQFLHSFGEPALPSLLEIRFGKRSRRIWISNIEAHPGDGRLTKYLSGLMLVA